MDMGRTQAPSINILNPTKRFYRKRTLTWTAFNQTTTNSLRHVCRHGRGHGLTKPAEYRGKVLTGHDTRTANKRHNEIHHDKGLFKQLLVKLTVNFNRRVSEWVSEWVTGCVIYEGPDIRIGSDRIDWRAGTPWGDGQKRIINAIIVQCQNEIRWHMRADGYPSRTEIPHKASAPFTSTIIIIIADRPTDRPTGFDGIKYFRCLLFVFLVFPWQIAAEY